jgi:hypothetical protein
MSALGWTVTILGVAAWFGLCTYLAIANGTGVC